MIRQELKPRTDLPNNTPYENILLEFLPTPAASLLPSRYLAPSISLSHGIVVSTAVSQDFILWHAVVREYRSPVVSLFSRGGSVVATFDGGKYISGI